MDGKQGVHQRLPAVVACDSSLRSPFLHHSIVFEPIDCHAFRVVQPAHVLPQVVSAIKGLVVAQHAPPVA